MKLSGILGLVAILGFGYYLRNVVWNGVASAVNRNDSACVELLGSVSTEDEGRTYITGTIRNNCERNMNSVTISFKVDSPSDSTVQGLPASTAFAYSNDLKPGETRSFKSQFPIAPNSSFRLDSINSF